MTNYLFRMCMCGCLLFIDYSCLCDSPFVVPKKKLQSSSKLKSLYAQGLADSIAAIPDLHKTLATIQEKLIHELTCLIDNDVQVTKTDLDLRVKGIEELKQYLNEIGQTITKHADSIKKPINGDCSNKK